MFFKHVIFSEHQHLEMSIGTFPIVSDPAVRPYMTQNTGLGRFWERWVFCDILFLIGPVWGSLWGHIIMALRHRGIVKISERRGPGCS